jgi:hypothetical protein
MKSNERLPEILATAVLGSACLLVASFACEPVEMRAAVASFADYMTSMPHRWQSAAELYVADASPTPVAMENYCLGGRSLTPTVTNAPCYPAK